jgi:hypothetical protein
MFRLLKYAPVVLPVIIKFVKSPQGQRAIASARARLSKGSSAATTKSTPRKR